MTTHTLQQIAPALIVNAARGATRRLPKPPVGAACPDYPACNGCVMVDRLMKTNGEERYIASCSYCDAFKQHVKVGAGQPADTACNFEPEDPSRSTASSEAAALDSPVGKAVNQPKQPARKNAKNSKPCRVECCDKPTVAFDLCHTHSQRHRNAGRPKIIEWLEAGAPTPHKWAEYVQQKADAESAEQAEEVQTPPIVHTPAEIPQAAEPGQVPESTTPVGNHLVEFDVVDGPAPLPNTHPARQPSPLLLAIAKLEPGQHISLEESPKLSKRLTNFIVRAKLHHDGHDQLRQFLGEGGKHRIIHIDEQWEGVKRNGKKEAANV